MAVVVGTWSFSLEAVKSISDKLKSGKSCVDALESGMNGEFCQSVFFIDAIWFYARQRNDRCGVHFEKVTRGVL